MYVQTVQIKETCVGATRHTYVFVSVGVSEGAIKQRHAWVYVQVWVLPSRHVWVCGVCLCGCYQRETCVGVRPGVGAASHVWVLPNIHACGRVDGTKTV